MMPTKYKPIEKPDNFTPSHFRDMDDVEQYYYSVIPSDPDGIDSDRMFPAMELDFWACPRVSEFIPDMPKDEAIIKTTDVALLGLNNKPWDIYRGARKSRLYLDANERLVVSDDYSYEMTEQNRKITSVQRHLNWYTNEGNVAFSKDVSPHYNQKYLKKVNRDIRQGRIDYLEASAEDLRDAAVLVDEPAKSQYLAIADSIDVLFDHYDHEVNVYIARGSMKFEQAIETESDSTILAILGTPAAPPSEKFPAGLTVRESIMYQLRGYLLTPGDVNSAAF